MPFWQFFREGQNGRAMLVRPSRIPRWIWKVLFDLGSYEFLAILEGKIRKCLFLYVKIFWNNSVWNVIKKLGYHEMIGCWGSLLVLWLSETFRNVGNWVKVFTIWTQMYLSFKRLSLIILCVKILKQEKTHSKCFNLIISPNFISSLKLALPLINFHGSSFFHV